MADEFEWIAVTKLDAAKRQLRTAIELWFHDGDPVSIHALAYAAHEIIHELFLRAGHTGLLFDLDPGSSVPKHIDASPEELKKLRSEFPKYLKRDANFFKHADRDPDDTLEFSPDVNAEFIAISLLGLGRLGEPYDAAARTFIFWYRLHRPEEFEESGAKPLPVEAVERWKRLYEVDKREFFRRYVDGLRLRGIT
jgi:hypothetical protein